MYLKSALLAGLMAAVAAANIEMRQPLFKCGTPEPSEKHRSVSKGLAMKDAASRQRPAELRSGLRVDVYMHIVASDRTVEGGYLDDQAMFDQIDIMNKSYKKSSISFKLKTIDKTINKKWAAGQNELQMKKKLRMGDYSDLNLYFVPDLGGGILGYCYFPTDAPAGSEEFTIDGCSIQSGTVPGAPLPPYNLGITAVHEVGHWLGLLHTFQDGCSGDGDFIADTPFEASPAFGCPVGRDSCPTQSGLDPIHNYMDYGDDSCLTEFTAEQTDRMYQFYGLYRI